MAGAERHAGIEHDADAPGRDRVDPRRVHEQPRADRQRRKVRLPVFRPAVVGDAVDRERGGSTPGPEVSRSDVEKRRASASGAASAKCAT